MYINQQNSWSTLSPLHSGSMESLPLAHNAQHCPSICDAGTRMWVRVLEARTWAGQASKGHSCISVLIGERSEPPSGLNGTRSLYNTTVTIPYISKCFYVNFFKRNHRFKGQLLGLDVRVIDHYVLVNVQAARRYRIYSYILRGC